MKNVNTSGLSPCTRALTLGLLLASSWPALPRTPFQVLKFPLLTIISIGHTGKNFVFVSVEPHTDEKMRFWIHAFACKSSDHAAATAAKLIAACSGARKAFTDAKASGGQVRMGADPNESNVRSCVSSRLVSHAACLTHCLTRCLSFRYCS